MFSVDFYFRCNYASYCSQQCLEEDKSNHEPECCYFARKRTGSLSSDTYRMVFKIILTMRSRDSNRLCDIVPGQKG